VKKLSRMTIPLMAQHTMMTKRMNGLEMIILGMRTMTLRRRLMPKMRAPRI
jgi:hypothetical protein